MDLIENILHYFQKNDDSIDDSAPEGTCPVCWGYQQYDKKIRDIFTDRQIDVNNHKDSYMLIQDFMRHKIDGVKLKEGVTMECPNCADEDKKSHGD